MLQLPQTVHDQIRRHGEAAYPHESCGIFLGLADGAAKRVVQARPAGNVSATPHNYYEIAPIDLIRAERDARAIGLQIIGFYHSHPDHPAQPSPADLADAHWIGCSYVITAVAGGSAALTHSFHLAGESEEDKHFQPEEIEISGSGSV